MAAETVRALLPAEPARRRRWSGLYGFAMTELRVQLHETLALATSMIVQTVFIVFVWVLSPGLLPFALVGAILFSVFQIGERVLNESAYVRIDHRLAELYHASPLTPEAYFLGMSMGIMAAYSAPVTALFVLAELVHPLPLLAVGVLLAVMLALWMFAASIGYMLSTTFEDSRAIWPYSSLLYNGFGVLPPVFYSFAEWSRIAPAPVVPLVLVLPPSASAALVTYAEGLTPLSSGEVLLAAGSILVEAVAIFGLAVYWARRAAREV